MKFIENITKQRKKNLHKQMESPGHNIFQEHHTYIGFDGANEFEWRLQRDPGTLIRAVHKTSTAQSLLDHTTKPFFFSQMKSELFWHSLLKKYQNKVQKIRVSEYFE